MAFNISNFKSQGLIHGGARPSLFRVVMPLPTLGLDLTSSTKFTFTCRTAELPQAALGVIEIPYFGRRIKVAGERSFSDWAVTVMNDEDFLVRSMFEKWSNEINRMVSNVRSTGADQESYKVTLDVEQFGKDGEMIRSYELVGAFPVTVGPIGLGWDSANAIEEFSVNFAYDYWVPKKETSSKADTNLYASATTDNGKNTNQ